MGGGRVDCYIDVASLYSYIAFADILSKQEELAVHGVTIDFRPVLLGAINAGSGNKPPWTLKAKAIYGAHDARRSAIRVGKPTISPPPDFLARSLTVLPLRALTYIQQNYPCDVYVRAWDYLFAAFWTPPHHDLTKPDVLARVLGAMPAASSSDGQTRKAFSAQEVERIMQATADPEIKETLKQRTQEALDRGAFGAPWMWATDTAGRAEPFFGSDRLHFVLDFLGVPYRDVTILPPRGEAAKESKL